jgi:hypothetical protein
VLALYGADVSPQVHYTVARRAMRTVPPASPWETSREVRSMPDDRERGPVVVGTDDVPLEDVYRVAVEGARACILTP